MTAPRRGAGVWQVHAGGPRVLDEVLRAMGVDAVSALAEGRVWVGRARARDGSAELALGEEVEVHVARDRSERAMLVDSAGGLVIAYKPAALPTEPDRAGHSSLVEQIGELVGGEPLHAVSRLDVGVSGVVLLSQGRAAHRRASALKQEGAIARRYIAVAERWSAVERGRIDVAVAARPATTDYAVVARAREHLHPDGTRVRPALLALDPVTGRKHQLRLHAKSLGAPLLGDRANGGVRRLTTDRGSVTEVARIMLHAAALELPREQGPSPWVVVGPTAADFVETWCALGGAAEDLERAIAAPTQ